MKDCDTRRKERIKVYNTEQWRRLSEWKRRTQPLCEVCQMQGKVTAGTDVHHLVSFTTARSESERYDLAYDERNLITLCDACHSQMHHGSLKGCHTKDEIMKRLGSL